ncbi:MAG: UDP-glucose/GDP-mannose dehydrogenase family protein [bacterium]
MKIAVMGTGYVGLVTGALLADAGNTVICVDIDERKVAMLREGHIPIYEEGLEPIVQRNHEDGRLLFTTDSGDAIKKSDIVFIAVGTPSDHDGSADLKYVLKVAETIGQNMNDTKIVICKSTVPVGTCDKVRGVIANQTSIPFHVISNPEFLKEGSAVKDFQSPDRVIIGSSDKEAAETVGELYKPFMRRNDRIVYMDVRSAEMTKYASNAMLATKISFMNEIANLCDRVGADVEHVRIGMSLDERIGPHFIFPGVGYGGSCFPKDVRALSRLGAEYDLHTGVLDAVEQLNDKQKLRLVTAAREHLGSLEGKTIAVWGLSFKPKTDDVREAPALIGIRALVAAGAKVQATDPVALENAQEELADLGDAVTFAHDEYDVLNGADALMIFTEWNQYRSPDFARMKAALKSPTIFDGRNLYSLSKMQKHGFYYDSIGRPTV